MRGKNRAGLALRLKSSAQGELAGRNGKLKGIKRRRGKTQASLNDQCREEGMSKMYAP